MGRKRNQGQARKAAKAKAKQEAEENKNGQAASNEAGEQLLLTAAHCSRKKCKCNHGWKGVISANFVSAFRQSFEEAEYNCTPVPNIDRRLMDAEDFTMEEFADVWSDPTKMESVMSAFLFFGTDTILVGDYDVARHNAVYARYFEQYIAVEMKQTQPLFRWNKIAETQKADMHTLVKFFKMRIPCSCLDMKYEEVKSISKMGMCFNPHCALPGGMTKRSKTLYCDRCLCITYCSRACQKSHWKQHKSTCEECAFLIDEFEATKQS